MYNITNSTTISICNSIHIYQLSIRISPKYLMGQHKNSPLIGTVFLTLGRNNFG
nr:MAG TPA: hypothetical protein [Bacteriophage sp.]